MVDVGFCIIWDEPIPFVLKSICIVLKSAILMFWGLALFSVFDKPNADNGFDAFDKPNSDNRFEVEIDGS